MTLFLLPFSCALECIRDPLLDLSRLLGLALRPFAPVFRCHPEPFYMLEAGTRRKPCVELFFVLLLFGFSYVDSVVLKRIQTAYEEFEFKGHWLTRP